MIIHILIHNWNICGIILFSVCIFLKGNGRSFLEFLNSAVAIEFFFHFQEAAVDADKVFLAAIDKFNAMVSKSNAYAPDGTSLHPVLHKM